MCLELRFVKICGCLFLQALSGDGRSVGYFNLSASNEIVGKYEYRKELARQQSARCIAGYVYTSSGVDESTTDVVFGGHAMIFEKRKSALRIRKIFD